MSGSTSDRVKLIIEDLFSGIAQRVDGELGLAERLESETTAARRKFQTDTSERTQRYEEERDALQTRFDEISAEAGAYYQAHYSAAAEEYSEALADINQRRDDACEAVQKEFDDTRWMVVSYFDENAGGSPKQRFEQFDQNLEKTATHLSDVSIRLSQCEHESDEILRKRRMRSESESLKANSPVGASEELLERFNALAEQVVTANAQIRKRFLPVIFSGVIPYAMVLCTSAACTAIADAVVDYRWLGFKSQPPEIEWLGLLFLASSMMAVTGVLSLFYAARGTAENDYRRLMQALTDSRAVHDRWRKQSARELKKQEQQYNAWYRALVDERDSRLNKASEKYDKLMKKHETVRSEELQAANLRYPELIESVARDRDGKLKLADEEYPGRLANLESRFEWDLKKLTEDHESSLAAIQQRYDCDWQVAAHTWQNVADGVRTSTDRLRADSAPVSHSWTELASGQWAPAERIPQGIRLGNFQLRLEDIEYGMPEDDRLIPSQCEFELPSLVPFPDGASILMRATGTEAGAAAVKVLQVAMLRLLTTLPPGKVRFTIIDPVGLGENFSAFMHLVDYDELLVTSRIWTENIHIEQRLGDLTSHMETVFQTYLRNEFKTIEEYNGYAGEVAEPYHILVIAGYPANITEQSARRLASIVASGPRCGVYTLMSVDPQAVMPAGFQLSHVEEQSTCLNWNNGQFEFVDKELSWMPFLPQEPPEPDEFSRIVKRVGDESKDARRVEVSFDRVSPKELWQQDSRSGIDIPLGRAGATKLQHLRLGRGTSQHVLIAGKTGSGKSTLMHILITNLAMHYSPDEVQFYLIDFKKGVEFKAYAANDLPHARVIAIESDREFGLSVLQRLDAILKERGDLFRDHGVQDIAALRNENPDTVMPRLLLFIDEFQEFFTEDDRISQQAALLLDRLVRQGRAFGIHILLGSQTLGGAYSLARSTLGQVAVRVALQCSESDAHLILSEENTAARLLTRPGEAIYNDANGLLEGNHPFQIAWLDDEKRDACLRRMVTLATEHQREPVSPIVFEGNIPADPLNNRELCNVFREERTETRKAFTGWLGEAVAIKPHTEIRFRRLSGSNLLVIGQSPNAARGILSTLLLGTVAQMQPLAAKVTGLNDVATGKHPGHGPEGSEPNSETVVTDQKATEDVNQSAAKLDAMKSFSFAGMQVENPLDAAPATGRLPSAAAGDIAQCYILDGSLADDEEESFWPDLVGQLPHRVRVGGPRQAAEFVRSISAEIQRRGDSEDDPPIVLIIDNLGRFRELRRTEDDFGFGTDRQREATPARLFVEILKSGPPAGVHTVVWADTFNNAGRWMTSQTMRELEMRVAFQMSATDSSNFIDTPIAGKLGQNRALLYLEEQGTHEKFRPYGVPSEDWLEFVSRRYRNTDDPEEKALDDLSEWTVL